MRRVWRSLSAAADGFDEALEQELLRGEPFLRAAGSRAAALRALREAGLLRTDGSRGYHLERPQDKVDVSRTASFSSWHSLFRTSSYLQTCLTAAI
jgi:hypothetical protein